MIRRVYCLLLLSALLAAPAVSKNKNKSAIPEDILRAQTVRVVIDPDAGEPLDQPNANAVARENVEKALREWGRFQVLLMDGAESDLIISVRTGNGRSMRPTIRGGPLDQRPGTAQTTDSTIAIGGQRGHPPMNDPNMGPINNGPHMGNEVGAPDDTFAVYRGGISDPLNSSPVWRYMAKDCLRAPKVNAVEEFRKAIVAAEKPQIPSKKP
jgi:hypothetical protein